MLEVSEIFYSIQGESTFAGLPFVFIRLTGCNLRCNYCDAKYAYTGGEKFEIKEIIKKLEKYSINNVEITGGEPLLQNETISLINKLLQNDYRVLIETNGSQPLKNIKNEIIKIVDIKTPGSCESGSFKMENLNYINKSDNIKFVVSDSKDFEWSLEFIREHNLTKKCNVLMSAVQKKLDYKKLWNWILEQELEIRFQLQLHKLIHPEKTKGV